jgi:hypothetical protein
MIRNSTHQYRIGIMHHNPNKKFTIRRLFSKKQHLETWNLCTVSSKPGLGKCRSETFNCTYIALDFATKEKVEIFEMEFKAIAGERLKKIEVVKQIRKGLKSEVLSANPLTGSPSSTQSSPTSPSDSSTLSFHQTLSKGITTTQTEHLNFWQSENESDSISALGPSLSLNIQRINDGVQNERPTIEPRRHREDIHP